MAAVFIPSVSQKAYAVEIRRLNETSGMNAFDEESVINIAVNPQNPSLIAVSSGKIPPLHRHRRLVQKSNLTFAGAYCN